MLGIKSKCEEKLHVLSPVRTQRQGVHFCFWISLPLTNEFEVHTVSWIYAPNTQAVGHKSEQEKQASIMYSMDQDSRLVRYLFYRWVQMEGGRF